MLLAETLALLRVFRPKIVALEQVHAFATHEDKKYCIAMFVLDEEYNFCRTSGRQLPLFLDNCLGFC